MRVALFEPEIPHNTGAVARLCLAAGASLHLLGRLGFQLDDPRAKRSGLDYFEHVELHRHADWAELAAIAPEPTWLFFSAHGRRRHDEATYPADATLVFGSETRGLPERFVRDETRCFRIPILDPRARCLNLSTAVAIVLWEALRQQGFPAVEPPR